MQQGQHDENEEYISRLTLLSGDCHEKAECRGHSYSDVAVTLTQQTSDNGGVNGDAYNTLAQQLVATKHTQRTWARKRHDRWSTWCLKGRGVVQGW